MRPARDWLRVGGLLLAGLSAGTPGPAMADDVPTPTPSLECRVPGSQLYSVASLAAAKAALEERHILRILAVGGSSAPGASASYPVKLEAALEQAMPHVDVIIDHRGLPGRSRRARPSACARWSPTWSLTSSSGRWAPTMPSPGSIRPPSPRPSTNPSRG
ncbi:hypothetical protein ACFQFG_15210 [Methylobacterium persicinum]